ncbi:MAG TPA: hypothetical protein VMX74_14655 [Pirellulales bacterium]|nr:hypothetical protein [Pirellulales bacterium]
MYNDDHAQRNAKNHLDSRNGPPSWLVTVTAVVVTLAFAQMSFIRPARQQMARLQREVVSLRSSIDEIAGHSETAASANQLLQQLAQQSAVVAEAADALSEIEDLQQRLTDNAARLNEANRAIAAMAQLRRDVQQNKATIQGASEVLAAMHELQDNILRNADETSEAQAVSYDLLALKQQLINEGRRVSSAQSALEQLIGIRTELDAQGADIELADQRAEGLIDLKNKVVSRTDDLVGSIETFERAMDLQQQFHQASEAFVDMRRMMTEMVILRSNVVQVVDHLKPLTDLVNLRRLSASQLRKMARTVTEQYSDHVANKPHVDENSPKMSKTELTGSATE